MRAKHLICAAVLLMAMPKVAVMAQEQIPVGTWRLHLSFSDLKQLALSSDRVFAANEIGVMVLNKINNEITSISKIDGLSSAGITAIAYDGPRDMLIIASETGLINIVQDNNILTFNNLAVTPAISGSRKINHIKVKDALAYLSTDFGLVVFDIDRREVKETYRDLSAVGGTLKIFESTIGADSIFLATENGVIAGNISGSSNLLDFRNWKRYTQDPFNGLIKSVTTFNNSIYAAINAQGIFRLINGTWIQENFLQNDEFKRINGAEGKLVITTATKIWASDGTIIAEVAAATNPEYAIPDADGTIWVADGKNGLISSKNGTVSTSKPNGPTSNFCWRVTYSGDRIICSKGGFNDSMLPLNRISDTDQFTTGQWSALATTLKTDITDQVRDASATYLASFGFGLEKITNNESQVFNDLNSPLLKFNGQVLIPSIETSPAGTWVANYGVASPLHLLSGSGTWESFSFSQPQAMFPRELLVDHFDQVWMIVDPAKGGGIFVFNKSSNETSYLSSVAGKGGLPTNFVRSIAKDREGQVWVGTNEGVVYFPNPRNVFGSTDASRPIFENRFLLRDESITAIAVDGGNRKWLGTTNGVWLFDPTGESLIFNFTEDNSPLPSNMIVSIAVDPKSGEVYFATDKGLASFRAAATESSFQFDAVKIFPNPVTAEFSGQVAINGLYRDAIVKITDLGGHLIWQTKANGGTATWNARQLNGNRVSTGMYFVFATSEDGSEKHVGKIVVIE